MKKLYEKNELLFAVLWIILYCAVTIPIRGKYGDESAAMLAALAVIAAGIFAFVKGNHLEKKYGLCKWKGKAADYCFFIPMLILMTGNLWGGFGVAYNGIWQVFAVISMLLIGFIEEMIFRGFLFCILLKKDPDKQTSRPLFRYSLQSHGDLYSPLFFTNPAAYGYVFWFTELSMHSQNLPFPTTILFGNISIWLLR